MNRFLIMILITCSAACATARDNAVHVTNTAQDVLKAVDEVWAPIVQDEIAKNHSAEDAEYKRAMAPLLVVQEAIEQARRATQLLNLAIQTWDAQADAGAMWLDVVPCVIQDLQLVRALLRGEEAHAPPQLTQALNVIEISLIAFAKPGAVCPKRPVAMAAPEAQQ